ncbi:MAG: hypothetical protein LBV79_11460 [Candidatus Adiutrix sp.]|jgi:hypothetical protein|nr:hypothetical protein [Candidatus Adiutrix sp.]
MTPLSDMRRWGGAALLLLALAVGTGCPAKPARLADPTAPPSGYQRQIMLVVETPNFKPVAGAEVSIETEAPTRLISPENGRGRTDARGGLLMVFEPLPHYDEAVLAGGDVLADFPIQARVTVRRGQQMLADRVLSDRETFARYADPLYQALNRDPEAGVSYYNIILP